MTAYQCMLWQLSRWFVEIGAARIRMNRLERMGHSLNLLDASGSVFQPNRWLKLFLQIKAFGIIVSKLVNFVLQTIM